uniref:Uncharacterized protein n=1 Tax=Caenorhabditis japonica TaxID=281687 RepID=A0A8R1E7R1_CAEJA
MNTASEVAGHRVKAGQIKEASNVDILATTTSATRPTFPDRQHAVTIQPDDQRRYPTRQHRRPAKFQD